MRIVVQRVNWARVAWTDAGGEHESWIGPGLSILLGVGPGDEEADSERLAQRVALLRIFSGDNGRPHLSLGETGGAALVVSQFTLYADTQRGRRPSYTGAAGPERARTLYECFVTRLGQLGVEVLTGGFGSHMRLALESDGPVTLVLSTEPWETRVRGAGGR